ncbi:phage tail assembly chaperone [Pseudomonas sp. NPDC078700]|uniref:phage tail assembly chaperone n=1 Tax=Pseudomonas sp. NPDC078700 TaxID=3364424 RepID=UPI0037C72799
MIDWSKVVTAESRAAEEAKHLAATERQWRDAELVRADNEIRKAEDGLLGIDPVAWRAYRIDLRNYPEREGFPTHCPRPNAPINLN